MPAAERTISINQPVAAVFPVLADGRRGMLWRPGEQPYEVTALEPEERVEVRLEAGSVACRGELELEPMGGATILTFRLAAELGGWRRLLFRRRAQAALDAEMAALDALRDLLER